MASGRSLLTGRGYWSKLSKTKTKVAVPSKSARHSTKKLYKVGCLPVAGRMDILSHPGTLTRAEMRAMIVSRMGPAIDWLTGIAGGDIGATVDQRIDVCRLLLQYGLGLPTVEVDVNMPIMVIDL